MSRRNGDKAEWRCSTNCNVEIVGHHAEGCSWIQISLKSSYITESKLPAQMDGYQLGALDTRINTVVLLLTQLQEALNALQVVVKVEDQSR